VKEIRLLGVNEIKNQVIFRYFAHISDRFWFVFKNEWKKYLEEGSVLSIVLPGTLGWIGQKENAMSKITLTLSLWH
jgi:hypothetical protein